MKLHRNKNLLKPKQLAQLEKQDDQTLETGGLVWMEKDVEEALKAFKSTCECCHHQPVFVVAEIKPNLVVGNNPWPDSFLMS